jgi:hypothetical protein
MPDHRLSPEGQPVKLADLDTSSDGAQLLGELCDALTRYVAFPSTEAADAVALWIAATHGQPAFEHATRLAIESPEKRCGKSRLLDVIVATSHAPLITVNISAAALVRCIGANPPTIVLDEADTVFGKTLKGDEKAEHLRGILNAGHQRNRPYTRWDAGKRALENCPTFAMAALAGIGHLPDTITDRAVVIAMRRRAQGETVASYRIRRDAPPLRELGERIGAWVHRHRKALEAAEPETGVDDRAHDCWEPLCAIADAAGGDWPARARKAAKLLTDDAVHATASGSGQLLEDLARVFGSNQVMPTAAILAALHAIEEAPWNDIYGKALDARGLAERLKPYGVRSRQVRAGEASLKGYRRDDLWDVWSRYLPPQVFRNMGNMGNTAGQGVSDVSPVSDDETCRNAAASDVSHVSDVSHDRQACTQCGGPLDQALIDAGFTDHGETARQ